MKKRLIITYILSLFDLAFTLYLEYRFGDIECNPFGQLLLRNTVVAIVYKIVVIGIALYVLYRCGQYRLSVILSWVIITVYALLFIYHIVLLSIVYYILCV